MKQGEIWYANLNPVQGSEQAGFRPVLIVSGNLLNDNLPIVIACPLTSNIKGYKGNLILEPDSENGLTKASEVLTFHIRSISKDRLKDKLGFISLDKIEVLKTTLSEILRY